MDKFLRVMLAGAIQAWGKQTYETFRPSEMFPTRSGVTGLVASALGIPRTNREEVLRVDASYSCIIGVIRKDSEKRGWGASPLSPVTGHKMLDYHIARDVRCIDGGIKRSEPTLREYLTDMRFVLLMKELHDAPYPLSDIEEALRNPRYLVYLGRKSCPPGEPFVREGVFQAESFAVAFEKVKGIVQDESNFFQSSKIDSLYSEERMSDSDGHIVVRDVPFGARNRLFETRNIYIHGSI